MQEVAHYSTSRLRDEDLERRIASETSVQNGCGVEGSAHRVANAAQDVGELCGELRDAWCVTTVGLSNQHDSRRSLTRIRCPNEFHKRSCRCCVCERRQLALEVVNLPQSRRSTAAMRPECLKGDGQHYVLPNARGAADGRRGSEHLDRPD